MKKNVKQIIIAILLIPALFYFNKLKALKKPILIGKKIIIGDSHGVGIGTATKGIIVAKNLAKGGWTLSNLMQNLKKYPITNDVVIVIISIGTNGQFASTDKIEDLVTLLHQKFTNAKLYIFTGSYGWSGTRTKTQILNRLTPYYKRFEKLGVTVLKNGLGYFKDGGQAHTTTTPQSKAIINEIETIIK